MLFLHNLADRAGDRRHRPQWTWPAGRRATCSPTAPTPRPTETLTGLAAERLGLPVDPAAPRLGGQPDLSAPSPLQPADGLHPHAWAGGPPAHQPLVDLDTRGIVAAPQQAGVRPLRTRPAPGGPRRRRERQGVRVMGRPGPADRGGAGGRRTRRPGARRLRLGGGARAGGGAAGQLLARRLPVACGTGGYGHTAEVGSFPENPYGLFDMAGNGRGVDERLVCLGPRCGAGPGTVLHPPQPARPGGRAQLRPEPAAVPAAAPGDQGRVVPLRGQLLPAIPPGGPLASDGRHRDEPYRFPLCTKGTCPTGQHFDSTMVSS